MTDKSNISHEVFASKNLYLESNGIIDYQSIKPFEYFQIIFGSCDHKDPQCPIYPFEKELCQEYIDWRAQQAGRKSKSKAGKKAIYNPAQPFRYNALVQAVYSVEPDAGRTNDNGRRSKTWVVVGDATSEDDVKVCGWDSLEELMGRYKFVVSTPATYVGRRRFKSNARYLYALAFDLDEVGVPELSEVIHQQMIGMTPQANIIVNSGDGIHLYYILAKPMPLYPKVYETLTAIKKALTRLIWNKASSRTGEDNQVQIQPIIQPFRVPGSRTKHGDVVTAWHNADATLHTIEELNRFASKPTLKYLNSGVSLEQAQALDKGAYSTNRLTKARAKELYPDWYQKRIIEGAPRKTWRVHRGLYEWWLNMLWTNEKVAVGHRYHCIMFLAVYARKCNVPFEELKRDALKLVPRMEALTGNTGRHFSVQDALDALKAYKESSETYPRQLIEDRSGLRIDKNKRNGRPQSEHIRIMNAIREVTHPDGAWRNVDGRPKATEENSPHYAKVQEWRRHNPNSNNKSLCARETGLDRKTVRKWWQSPWDSL
jgi:hypothetical protein